MRRRLVAIVLLMLVASSCGGGSDGAERSVLVDFTSDEFASSAFLNVPEKVTVEPGTTIAFQQTWTGEPHTVTGGTTVSDALKKGDIWIRFFETFDALAASDGAAIPDPEDPGDATWQDVVQAMKTAPDRKLREEAIAAYQALLRSGVAMPSFDNPPPTPFSEVADLAEELSEPAFEGLPLAFGEEDKIAQNIGQPCYLRSGAPPEKAEQPCAKADQRQPVFDGKQTFYNSGIIPYEGNEGNTFKVKLADDIEPGTYLFYCAVHGLSQTSEIEVRSGGARIPSRDDVARQTRREIAAVNEPLEKIYREAVDKNRFEVAGEVIEGPFAGLFSPKQDHALINEFVPKERKVKAGEPLTWKMLGSDHTISFGVPAYFPIIEFRAAGVRVNPKLAPPQGGAPEIPEQEGDGVLKIDGGTYDGTGFWSSGLIGAHPYAEYTVRISKPGTYNYACLIHPPMVGKLTVT